MEETTPTAWSKVKHHAGRKVRGKGYHAQSMRNGQDNVSNKEIKPGAWELGKECQKLWVQDTTAHKRM